MPEVIGLKLTGKLPLGSTATDLVLTIAELLRKYGVVGKFVEVFGPGLANLSVPDRATIGNMSPEFGCTITYFPIDDKTLEYMRKSNRSEEQMNWWKRTARPICSGVKMRKILPTLMCSNLILSTIEPTVAGPKRPQDKILLKDFKPKFIDLLDESFGGNILSQKDRETVRSETSWKDEGGNQPVTNPQTQRKGTIETKENRRTSRPFGINRDIPPLCSPMARWSSPRSRRAPIPPTLL